MLRIFLIIAIVAGIAATALTVTKVQEIIVTTRQARDDYHKKDDDEIAAHNKTKKSLKDTQATLATTQKNLDQTKSELEASNGKVDQLTKGNTELTAKLDKASSERDDAQGQLERWRVLGLSIEQIKAMVVDLDKARKAQQALTGENKMLATQVTEWKDKYNAAFNNEEVVVLPTGLRGKVVAVDPKFNFVVLNIGSDQGARQRGEMMVDRDGKLVGKIKISSVSKTQCVANILTGAWKRGDIMEGDEVLY